MTTIVGIDVSRKKASYHILNICKAQGSSGSFIMEHDGFTSLISQTNITSDTRCIMETNGVYHLPLQNLKNTKTYKADAFVIASFGEADMKEIEIKRDNMSKETQVKACARIGQEIGKDIARVKIQLKSN